ncbi:hypothetical protein J41TS12_43770 [Paenibacillus antibioticophila]|uniref:Uncharacterized protein n=1 Tax=Paenibacillus antibioticophila TaxID=1274374 RepID=A0A919XUH1_9BACL|nr:hypothetical protein J41TS12_43770 [Paenibacillus antibioticophila]
MNTQFQITQASINDLEELVAIFDQYRIFYNQAADPEGASQVSI